MPTCRLVRCALALPLLVFSGLLGASVSPGSDPHPRLAESEIALADLIFDMPVRSDEIGFRPIDEMEAAPEVMFNPDRASWSGEKDRRGAIREWAARLMQRYEAEIAWRFGRVSAR